MGKKKAGSEASKAVVMAPQKKWGRKKILLLALAAVVIVGSGFAAFWLSRDRQADPTANEAAQDNQYQQARDKSDDLRASRNYDGAKEVWQAYVDDSQSTKEEKYKAFLQLAALDETKGDCTGALRNYREAEKYGTGEWRAENEAIARCSEKTGDLQTALTYYQKTLDTFPGGEEYSSDLRYYRNKITKLKQQFGQQ